MKTAGIILLVLGLAATVFFGVQALNESESFSFLGIDVAVSSANWTPVIISAAVMVIGIILASRGKR